MSLVIVDNDGRTTTTCDVCSELWVMVCPVDRVGEVGSSLSM